MLFKWDIIFNKRLEIFPVFSHEIGCVLAVPVVVAHVSIKLISQCTKEAVSASSILKPDGIKSDDDK